jgi:enoyl-CoA hydratase
MSDKTVIVETKGRIGVIRLNRPQALNALNAALMTELGAAVAACEADPNISCMVITGSEKAFAAGADIKEMANKSYLDAYMGDFPGGRH